MPHNHTNPTTGLSNTHSASGTHAASGSDARSGSSRQATTGGRASGRVSEGRPAMVPEPAGPDPTTTPDAAPGPFPGTTSSTRSGSSRPNGGGGGGTSGATGTTGTGSRHGHEPGVNSLTARRPGDKPGIKHFVIDTNVLLHDPAALFVFEEHEVVIPFMVIEEIDTFKRDVGDRGRNARECIRNLDQLREIGRLADGVNWASVPTLPDRVKIKRPAGGSAPLTGMVRVDITTPTRPSILEADKPDNRIIAVAYSMQLAGVTNVVFVSKDLNARIKADALGLRTEDFENQKVDADKLYQGHVTLDVAGDLIDELYRDRMLPIDRLDEALTVVGPDGSTGQRSLYGNQFVHLRDLDDESHTGLARRLADTDHLIPVTNPRKPTFGILPRNVQQTMAMDLLMDDDIRMVTLLGSAGTGKTLVAVAAGMAKVFSEERYDKLLVARPIMPMGRDIGYLPGTKDDKLAAWMMPIFDNLAYLLSTRGATIGNGHQQHAESHSTEQRMQKLIADGKLVLEPLTYIRGRSIPHQFMIVDEAQNLTPHEIKTIISRIGDGTKIVLTGDIQQIDNPYLDAASNGLSYAIEKMKGLSIVGHVTLDKSERSELASLAAALL